jgi:hypothetical protein
MGSERTKHRQSPIGNLQDIKSKNSNQNDGIIHPKTHRYTKSSLYLSKETFE